MPPSPHPPMIPFTTVGICEPKRRPWPTGNIVEKAGDEALPLILVVQRFFRAHVQRILEAAIGGAAVGRIRADVSPMVFDQV